MTTRQVTWDQLDDLVPDEFDKYWELTLDFLKFIREQWPAILAEKGRIEPAERRDRLIEAEAARLANTARSGDRRRLDRLDPGDRDAARDHRQAAAWRGGAARPRHRSRRRHLGRRSPTATRCRARPSAIRACRAAQAHRHRARRRRNAWRRAARPRAHRLGSVAAGRQPASFGRTVWRTRHSPRRPTRRCSSIAVIEAANAEEEALAIAVALREAVEDPGKTAALVTPDVGLGRRVMALLARWNVPVDDSRGARAGRHAGWRVRAACRRGGARRRRAGAAAGAAQASVEQVRWRRRVRRWSARSCAARGRSTAPPGSTDALQTFRSELAKFRASERSSLHRSDPRAVAHRRRARCRRRSRRAAQDGAGAVGSTCRAARSRSRTMAARHADVVVALGGMTPELADAFDEIEQAGALDVDRRRLRRAVPRGHRRPHDLPAARPRRGCASSACSKRACNRSIAWCSAAWSKASGRRRRAAIRGSAGRCATTSASICRSGASACRRTISRRRSARREVILSRAAKLGGAPTVASRFVQRLAAVAGKTRWDAALDARRTLRRAGAPARRNRSAESRDAAGADAAIRGAAAPAQRHRDRGPAARSLHDLRQARSQARAARRRSTRRPARPIAAP